MPLTHSWGKGHAENKTSAMTGIFPGCMVVNGELEAGKSVIGPRSAQGNNSSTAGSGIYIPFSDLTGLNIASASPELGDSASAEAGPDGTPTQKAEKWKEAGAARFLLGVLEAGYAAQQSHPTSDRLGNCVMTRSSLSVVDEDTLQKIAERTGGQYFRADSQRKLQEIYDKIDEMEKTEMEVDRYFNYDELFPYLVIAGLVLLLLELILANTVWLKLP